MIDSNRVTDDSGTWRFAAAGYHGCRQRMFADPLDAGRIMQELGLGERRDRGDGHERGLSFRQRSGLVQEQRRDLLRDFERFGVPEQHAELRAAAGRRP